MTEQGTGRITVLIVDDDLYVRESLSDFLATASDIRVLDTCANGAVAVARVREYVPDVVPMDIHMPIMDGAEATRLIMQIDPAVRVLALSSFGDDEAVADMLDSGAAGFLIKTTSPHVLVDAIRSAHNGLTIVPSETLRRWTPGTSRRPAIALTERELRVLHLLADGLNNRQIGAAMFLSGSTVKSHLSDLMRKLDARTRTGVVSRAHELGLLTPREPPGKP